MATGQGTVGRLEDYILADLHTDMVRFGFCKIESICHANNGITGSHYHFLESSLILDTEIPRIASYTPCDPMLAINLPSSPSVPWALYTSSLLRASTS